MTLSYRGGRWAAPDPPGDLQAVLPTPTLPQEPERVDQAELSYPLGLRQDWLLNSA